MRYNTIKFNDVANSPGIAVSLYLQGCVFRCKNCHNPEAWDFEGGQEFTKETLDSILSGLVANGITRSLCILGGEPLCPQNVALTEFICACVRQKHPDVKIYIWTGYTLEQLLERQNDAALMLILKKGLADVLIDGPFIEEQKDLTLKMRGSANQRIIELPIKDGEA